MYFSFPEFLKANPNVNDNYWMQEAFSELDDDANGFLTKKELRPGKFIGNGIDIEIDIDIDELCKQLDKEDDDQVSYEGIYLTLIRNERY